MTDRDQPKEQDARPKHEPEKDEQSTLGKDVMRGRSFAGANIANTEDEQTRERQRIADHGGENLDEINEVTDAEIEARENNED